MSDEMRKDQMDEPEVEGHAVRAANDSARVGAFDEPTDDGDEVEGHMHTANRTPAKTDAKVD